MVLGAASGLLHEQPPTEETEGKPRVSRKKVKFPRPWKEMEPAEIEAFYQAHGF